MRQGKGCCRCPFFSLLNKTSWLRYDIRILAPKALLMNAESNERNPHASMRVMGEKLAKEVHR